MRSRIAAATVGVAIALTGVGTAHAAAQNTPQIRMTSTSTTCDSGTATIHATLYNGNGTGETVVVYLEPNSGGNTLGVPVANANVAAGDVVGVNLPYENGEAVFMAVAVTGNATVPTMWQSNPAQTDDLKAMRAAGNASDTELFPTSHSGQYRYPTSPCPSPAPAPCPPNWPINPYPVPESCPSATPLPQTVAVLPQATVSASAHPSTTPKVTSSASSTHPRATRTTVAAVAPPKKSIPTSIATSATQPVPTSIPIPAAAPMAKEADAVPSQISSMKRTGSSSQAILVTALIAGGFGVGCVLAGRRLRRN